MNGYTIYDLNTGEVIRAGNAPVLEDQVFEGEGIVPIQVDPNRWYFDLASGELVEQAPLPVFVSPSVIPADGITYAVISGIPSGTRFWWPDGEAAIADGGDIEFAVDQAGVYAFSLHPIQFLDQEVTIEAVPAA